LQGREINRFADFVAYPLADLLCKPGSSVSQNSDYRLLQRRTIRLIRFGGSERFCSIFL
jgi:hypothetical protein